MNSVERNEQPKAPTTGAKGGAKQTAPAQNKASTGGNAQLTGTLTFKASQAQSNAPATASSNSTVNNPFSKFM